MNAGVFILFAASFARPETARDWKSLGAFSAFIVALFAEMYGFPLTIYLASGWLAARFPSVDFGAHDAGHLWHTLLGWKGDPHWDPLHVASYLLIGGGFWLLAAAWPVLYTARREGALATWGPYARIRHPQYAGFILIMLGFLFQWPTLLTLAMFPILVFMYVRLALIEEREEKRNFGSTYEAYARRTPRWIPRLRREASTLARGGCH
jgi:protein-S-isoprenylcysteine O-methyltransferase Ste14